jgi:hypothetical protein
LSAPRAAGSSFRGSPGDSPLSCPSASWCARGLGGDVVVEGGGCGARARTARRRLRRREAATRTWYQPGSAHSVSREQVASERLAFQVT